ncbi:unnamed protein product [Rotaria sordida]|uniref:MI domain-containing protein n=2 Tax=Rotaria sordida TaxID=392033 RepID=A0A814UU31_9BILA|nr:unnamed protein product [Rotaria sordida]CAF3944042.1 unnamed protein product [Rotaria sordida]
MIHLGKTISTNTDPEQCAFKLLQMDLNPQQEMELCQMIMDICVQRRTYEAFFGLLSQALCVFKKEYVQYFEKLIQVQYKTGHGLENVKLRSAAKLFTHLLVTNTMSWAALDHIPIAEEDKTSTSAKFLKMLLSEVIQHLSEPHEIIL